VNPSVWAMVSGSKRQPRFFGFKPTGQAVWLAHLIPFVSVHGVSSVFVSGFNRCQMKSFLFTTFSMGRLVYPKKWPK